MDFNEISRIALSYITYCRKQVYKVKVNDVDELCRRIQTVWDELDQHTMTMRSSSGAPA